MVPLYSSIVSLYDVININGEEVMTVRRTHQRHWRLSAAGLATRRAVGQNDLPVPEQVRNVLSALPTGLHHSQAI